MDTGNSTLKGIIHGVIPALLLSMSVGQIYAFTMMANDLVSATGSSLKTIQWAFSLGIFFLGMGAAFFGPLVEKNIKKAAVVGMLLFLYGLVATAFAAYFKSSIGAILSYGVFLGLGTGIVYISPVKTMMLWFKKSKAVASAIPIVAFGLGSSLSAWLYTSVFGELDLVKKLVCISVVYFAMMTVGILLLKKPLLEEIKDGMASRNKPDDALKFSYSKLIFKDFFFQKSWLFMFINISAGLCLIPLSKQLMQSQTHYAEGLILGIIAAAGLFNGGGRLVFAGVSDMLEKRKRILVAISLLSVLGALVMFFAPAIGGVVLLINACYGAGFAVIPAILSDRYGMDNLSKIHGAVLSAWGFAGLVGNQAAMAVWTKNGYVALVILILVMHVVNLANTVLICKDEAKEQ